MFVSETADASLAGHCEQHHYPAQSSSDVQPSSQPVIAGVGNTVAPTTVGHLASTANVFLELFAGEAKLTQAVQDAGCTVETPLEKRTTVGAHAQLDFTSPEVFSEINKKARQQHYKWIHAAPPCSSFSRARRTDKWGSVPVLRSDEFPMGLPEVTHPKLTEANKIVRALSRLVRTQHRAGQGWSIENPANSLIWQTTHFRQLAALPLVRMVVFDQCCHGAEYKKPTGLLTNMVCFEQLAKRCPGQPTHPVHPPLAGKTWDDNGNWVWKTSLAAAYPTELCQAMANCYHKVATSPPGATHPIQWIGNNRVDPLLPPACKIRRATEAEAAIGGLRDPAISVSKLPDLDKYGDSLNLVLAKFLDRDPSAVATLSSVTQGNCEGFSESTILLARRYVCMLVGIPWEKDMEEVYTPQSRLLGALVQVSNDPDTSVPAWLAGSTPLGIELPIQTHGIFPTLSPQESMNLVKRYAPPTVMDNEFTNYSSYRECQEQAVAELTREEKAGFVEFGPRESLEQQLGPLTLSRIGVVVTTKDGKTKHRLIHDLSRSGVNHLVKLPERQVLPRLDDITNRLKVLARTCKPGEDLEIMVLDFKDAFKQLQVSEQERHYLAGECPVKGCFSYKRIMFGVASGPLTWGRVAAQLMRFSQALSNKESLAMACFVDDPIIGIVGTDEFRSRLFTKLTLPWATLGFRLAWSKACRGTTLVWIGVQIAINMKLRTICLTIPADKLQKLVTHARSILACSGVAPRKLVRSFAGLGEWVAGVVPQLKPFMTMVWAALSTDGKDTHFIFVQQITRPLNWVVALIGDRPQDFKRLIHIDPPVEQIVIATDASPWGGGAVLWMLPAGDLPSPEHLQNTIPALRFTYTAWDTKDEKLLGAIIGEPAGQARWEAFTILASMCLWKSWWSPRHRQVTILGDALGIMEGASKFRSKDAKINAIFAELALVIAPTGATLAQIHLWSERNSLADALSRFSWSPVLPSVLTSVQSDIWPKDNFEYLAAT